MSHVTAGRTGALQRPSTATLGLLVGLHLAVLVVILARAEAVAARDADVARATRIATSPAVPYLGFPVEFMPLQTAFARLVAGGDLSAAAQRIAIVAFLADLAAAAAMAWGWGRRQASTYLVLGLPLLSFLYLRFDLVAVALAAWGLAFLVRRRPELAGGALGLAIMAKLWPLVLLPLLDLRKARRGLLVAIGICVVLGAWWFLTGGPKGPFQVLSVRETRGWHVESVVGSFLWALGRGEPYREADAIRIGHAVTWAKLALAAGFVAVEIWLWRRAARDRRDAMGAAALAAVAATAVFAPIFSLQAAAWLLPMAALAFEGGRDERHTAGVATVAIVLTGALAIAWQDHAVEPDAWVRWLVLARNLVWIDIVVSWLRVPALPIQRPAAPEPPQRRTTDSATDGIEAVLPFDAE